MKNTSIRAALVSTNSVSQGESVANLWKPLLENDVHIDFAYRTFQWDSEAKIKAHVHCVIIGFSIAPYNKPKKIFIDERYQIAKTSMVIFWMQRMYMSRAEISLSAIFQKSELEISQLMVDIIF